MAGHHDSGVHTLLAERDRLVRAILGFRGDGGGSHNGTIKAVRDFLWCHGAGIPWVRMYQLFPSWQQQCGLLDQEWDRDAVLERAKMIFTLINPHGTTIRRKALGGRSWKGTGAETIGNEFVLTKLYYKREGASRPRDGFTAFEFHLPMNEQPRVAICVLHQTNHRHLIRDLREYIHEATENEPLQPDISTWGVHVSEHNSTFEGYFLGEDQANNLQMVQRLGPINSAPVVGGLMYGLQFDQTINQASENEGVQYGHAPPGSSPTSLYNTWPTDGIAYHITAMLPEQDAPTDQVSMQNDSPITLSGISMGMPNRNAMGYFPGEDQANNLQMVQRLGPINSAPVVGGLMYGLQFDQTINHASENEGVQYGHAPPGSSPTSLYNTWPTDGIAYHITAMLPEQDAPTDQVSMQNDSPITLSGISMGMPNRNAMATENESLQPADISTWGVHVSEHNSTFETNDNEPSWLETFSPSGYYSAATANNFPPDEHNLFPGFS